MIDLFVEALVFNYLTDKISVKKVYLLSAVLGLLVSILLSTMPILIVVLVIVLFLFGMFDSSIGIIGPIMVPDLFIWR